jgi:hypothetical protein
MKVEALTPAVEISSDDDDDSSSKQSSVTDTESVRSRKKKEIVNDDTSGDNSDESQSFSDSNELRDQLAVAAFFLEDSPFKKATTVQKMISLKK